MGDRSQAISASAWARRIFSAEKDRTRAATAERFGVSVDAGLRAKTVLHDGTAALIDAVESGDVAVSLAAVRPSVPQYASDRAACWRWKPAEPLEASRNPGSISHGPLVCSVMG
jgi:hypothetical protein